MIISIAGAEGSGKSTVADILVKKLNMESYYMGGLRREVAKKKGMTLEAYNKLGEKDPSTDYEVDEYQKKLGKTKDNFIIQGRTSFHFIPQSFKVYLDVDEMVAAKRIYDDAKKNWLRSHEGNLGTLKDALLSIRKRRESDNKRYTKYYKGLDVHDKKNFDLVIDTTHHTPEEVADIIIKTVKTKNL